jgi:hypothetical protein
MDKKNSVFLEGDFNEGHICIELLFGDGGKRASGAIIKEGIAAGRRISAIERQVSRNYLTCPEGVYDSQISALLTRFTKHPYPGERVIRCITESICTITLCPTEEELISGFSVEEKIVLTSMEVQEYPE